MSSVSGRFVICFNGEVFNFSRLRAELEPLGHAFRGGSDTEVMLAAIEQWGLPAAVGRFIGMFAFALWDAKERTLSLVRDRLGIKPLYYGRAGRDFVFGSELKALRAHPDFDGAIDRAALTLYFRHNYIPAPHSIHGNARKLPPGHILILAPDQEPVLTQYWSAAEVYARGAAKPFAGSEDESLETLSALLTDAVGLRMLSDVPLGAFLSGGIDSSLVVALMQAQSTRPVKTFSIGFAEERYNEAPHARAVAAHLGTDHEDFRLSQQDLLDIVPLAATWWDEPFADPSQIPTYAVCQLARRHVTVALSGDGGDELFLGYARYPYALAWRERLERQPMFLRRAAATLSRLPAARALPGPLRWRLDALGLTDFAAMYKRLLSHHPEPARLVLGAGQEPPTALDTVRPGDDLWRSMSLWDVLLYLTDDILTKVDRASMAVSLEARVPLLDHRVVEFAASLPSAWLVRDGVGKTPLRRLLHAHVPRELVDRPKMGFGVPLDLWLKAELRPWAEALLDETAMRQAGVLDARLTQRLWRGYLAGRNNEFALLWCILMYQNWSLQCPAS
jgi:asparagine synthase (glutamine-hydrolysing)